jgi:hypothetical protein
MPLVHLTGYSVAHTNPPSFWDNAIHDFAILVAMFTGLQPVKPRYGNPHVNLMALVARIYGPTPPEL